jgi:hypothetical protein
MREIVLTHPDGTSVAIDRNAATWTEPSGHVIKEDRPLWPPKAYAARLIRLGFHREGWQ